MVYDNRTKLTNSIENKGTLENINVGAVTVLGDPASPPDYDDTSELDPPPLHVEVTENNDDADSSHRDEDKSTFDGTSV